MDTKSAVAPPKQNACSMSSAKSPRSVGSRVACMRRGAEKELVGESGEATQLAKLAPAKDDKPNEFLDLQLGP